MLSKPYNGWTNFTIGDYSIALSYLTNVPLDWLDQAIYGLRLMQPFVVRGALEPGRMLCLVSFHQCHVLFEDDEYGLTVEGEDSHQTVRLGMLDFCRQLHRVISDNLEAWAHWEFPHSEADRSREKEELQVRLDLLAKYIDAREDCFGSNREFF